MNIIDLSENLLTGACPERSLLPLQHAFVAIRIACLVLPVCCYAVQAHCHPIGHPSILMQTLIFIITTLQVPTLSPNFQSDSLTHAMISSRMSRTFQNLLLVPLTRARALLYLPFLITLAMI